MYTTVIHEHQRNNRSNSSVNLWLWYCISIQVVAKKNQLGWKSCEIKMVHIGWIKLVEISPVFLGSKPKLLVPVHNELMYIAWAPT